MPGTALRCTNRRENVTDWALELFREHYGDKKIAKWDIFYYVYAVLHHPEYRERYAENLKRELPRIPLVGCAEGALECGRAATALQSDAATPGTSHAAAGTSGGKAGAAAPAAQSGSSAAAVQSAARAQAGSEVFWAFAHAGKQLADLHITYEQLEPYKLKFLENKDVPLSYGVEDKMRLSKDRRSLRVNDSPALAGIPPETFEYRLGNRSALEWVIDQYQVTEDKHSGIRFDPNRPDDPEYIVRLVGQIIYVSLETVRIVNSLPPL